jgi:anti-sigma factor RsiW
MTESACRATLECIEAYLDGELPASACQAIDDHCRTCEACDAYVAGLRQMVGLCRQAATAPLPGNVRARALESVRKLLIGS